MTDDLIKQLRCYPANRLCRQVADALEAKDARIAALEAAIEERHRHYLELELRCRDLEAEKQAFKDGNKYND